MRQRDNVSLLFLRFSFPSVSPFWSSFTAYSNIFRLVFLFSNNPPIIYLFRFVSSSALSIFNALVSHPETMSNTSGNLRPYFDSEKPNTRQIQYISLLCFRFPSSCSSSHFSLQAPIPESSCSCVCTVLHCISSELQALYSITIQVGGAVSSAGLRPKSDCSGKAQKLLYK
jgi:hypothetical protein